MRPNTVARHAQDLSRVGGCRSRPGKTIVRAVMPSEKKRNAIAFLIEAIAHYTGQAKAFAKLNRLPA